MAKLSRTDVFRARRDNYAHHYDRRKWAKGQSGDLIRFCVNACAVLETPHLNFFGNWAGEYFEGDNWTRLLSTCKMHDLHPCDLVFWYWSEEGWERFQKEFNNLAEPEKLSTAVVDKSLGFYPQAVDKSPLIHISTALVDKNIRI